MICVEIARVEDSPFEYRSPRPTVLLHRACSWMCDLTDGPDEAHQLTSNSDRGDGRAFAAAGHSMEFAIETQIAFFGDVDHLLRLIFAPPPDDGAVADSPVVLPGRLHGDVPDVSVAGLGDGEPVGRIAGTRLPRHQADRCHQLRRSGETPQIAQLREDRHRGEPVDAAQHAQRRHVCRVLRRFGCRFNLIVVASALLEPVLVRSDQLRQYELAMLALKLDLAQPRPELLRPCRFPLVVPMSIAKYQLGDAMPHAEQVLLNGVTSPHQIAHRLPSQIRYYDQRQHVAGAQIPPELGCIAPVSLDPLARLAWRQRRRRDVTLQTRFGEPPIQLIAARTSFVHDPNLATQLFAILDQLPIPIRDRPQFELPGRLVLVALEMRDGPLVRVIVDPNPMDNLHDPFLLYVALHPSGCNPRKGT